MEERGEEWQPAPLPQLPPPPPPPPNSQAQPSSPAPLMAGLLLDGSPEGGKKIRMLRPLGHGGKK